MAADHHTTGVITSIVREIIAVFREKKKLLLCGNGGSAAEAHHLAAEFSGKFLLDRRPLFAQALCTNAASLTAVANDYGYDHIFSRAVSAQGQSGDILIVLTTSGMSKNIIECVRTANDLGLITVALTGEARGTLDTLCRFVVKVPSGSTPRIQEVHLIVGHIICEMVEYELFND